MRLRLTPLDTQVFRDLATMGDLLLECANALAELFGTDPVYRQSLVESLAENQRRSDALTATVMQRLNATFIPPLDREDVYGLAAAMDRCVRDLAASGDLVVEFGLGVMPARSVVLVSVLVRQAELTAQAMRRLARVKDLVGYWVEIHRLENEADRTYHRLLAEIFDDGADIARMLKLREVMRRLDAAGDSFTAVARMVQIIAVKER
ncbi:MAG: DUF47 domain-containing protein [Actinomycetales bacterium]